MVGKTKILKVYLKNDVFPSSNKKAPNIIDRLLLFNLTIILGAFLYNNP